VRWWGVSKHFHHSPFSVDVSITSISSSYHFILSKQRRGGSVSANHPRRRSSEEVEAFPSFGQVYVKCKWHKYNKYIWSVIALALAFYIESFFVHVYLALFFFYLFLLNQSMIKTSINLFFIKLYNYLYLEWLVYII